MTGRDANGANRKPRTASATDASPVGDAGRAAAEANGSSTPCNGASDPVRAGGGSGGRGGAERLGIDLAMLELLVCPLGGGALVLDAENAVLISRKARLAYPVRDGIPILAPGEATPLDEHDPRLHPRRG